MELTLKDSLRSIDHRYAWGLMGLVKKALNQGALQRVWHILRMTRQPIFIGGCGRSGTTLVLSLLSAHPNLYAIPYETQAVAPGPYPPTEDSGQPFNFPRLYAPLMDAPDWIEGCTRWCEKTPGNVHYATRLLDTFGPQSRFINVVRDGRNVVTSRHQYHAPNQYWVSPERWIRDVRAGRQVEGHSQVLTIRYEDIVTDHMTVLKEICQFLEVSFPQDAFADYPDTAKTLKTRDGRDKPPRPVSKSDQKRWKKDEHREIVEALLEQPEARSLLAHYGYREASSDHTATST
jgi:hypothetical protein